MRASCARCGAPSPANAEQGVHLARAYVCTKCQNAAESIPVQLSKTAVTVASSNPRKRNMQLDFDDSPKGAGDKTEPKSEAAKATATDRPAAGQPTRAAAADAAKRLAAAAATAKATPRTAAVPAPRPTPRPAPTATKAGAADVPEAAATREPEAPISMSDLPTIANDDTVVPSSSELEIVDHETVQSDAVEAIARTMRAEDDGAEPVSIKELEMIMAPGVAPPRIAKPGTSGPPGPPPRKRPPQRAAADDLASSDLAAMAAHAPATPKPGAATARPRAKARVPAPGDSSARDLELMGRLSATGAPAAPRGAKPGNADSEAIEPAPDSRMNDILGMAAGYRAERPSAPSRTAKIDIAPDSGDVFALRGGLFDGSLMPNISTDLSLPTAPTESLPPLVSPTDPPPRSRGARARRAAAVTPSSTPQQAPAQGGRNTGLWIGAIAVAAASLIALTRTPSSQQAAAPSEPERAPAAAAPPPRAPLAPMAEEPSIDDAPPGAKAPEPAPESAPATHAPHAPNAPNAAAAPQTSPAVAAQPAAQPATPKPVAPAAAAPPPSGTEFDTSAASRALSAATGQASSCRAPGDPSGTARVTVTFAPSGRVTSATLSGPPFAGTATGGCIARTLRTASVPAFSGSPVQVSRTITVR